MIEAIRITPGGFKREITNLRKLIRFAIRQNNDKESLPIMIVQVNDLSNIPEESRNWSYKEHTILAGPLNLELSNRKNVLLLSPNKADFVGNQKNAYILNLAGHIIQFEEIEFTPLYEGHRDGYRYLNGLLIFFAGNHLDLKILLEK